MTANISFNNKVLFVDDDNNILESFKRQFRKTFQVSTALNAMAAFKVLETEGPFAVIVSDMRMPHIDGATFLEKVKTLYPLTVRVMLTGNADLKTAVDSVNKGEIFKFLNKPCPASVMMQVLESCLNQYYLTNLEPLMLEHTVKGCVKVLTDVLSLVNPIAFSQGQRLKQLVILFANKLKIKDAVSLELAALLYQIGCVTIPPLLLERAYKGQEITDQENKLFNSYPLISCKLIAEIPKLEEVAQIISDSLKEKFEEEDKKKYLNAGILKISIALDKLLYSGLSHQDALRSIYAKRDTFHPTTISICQEIDPFMASSKKEIVRLSIIDLKKGMFLAEDIKTRGDGILLVSKGAELNNLTLELLENYYKEEKISNNVLVTVSTYGG